MNKQELLSSVVAKIKWPCYYDKHSQFVFDQDGKMIIDIRGWGWIQKLGPDAEKMQDAFGERIVELINSMKPASTSNSVSCDHPPELQRQGQGGSYCDKCGRID